MQERIWEEQRVLASEILPPPFAELIQKTTQPFVSSIVDIGVSKPSFFDGKLLMVGDALVPFRPHVACSTNQAAMDALLVEKMLSGEMSWYQFGYLAFFFSEARFRYAGYVSRIRKFWQG